MANPVKNLTDKLREVVVKDENNPGTPEHSQKIKDMETGLAVLSEWNDGETLYSEIFNKISSYRDFYLGEMSEQWNSAVATEGDLKLIFNIGATTIDLFTYILANQPPYVQFIPEDSTKISQIRANFGEDLVKKIFKDAKFEKRFRDGVKTQFMLGFVWPYLFWNPQNKDGGKKGTLEMTLLNGFTTRLTFASNDYEKVQSFVTMKRLSAQEIKKLYDFDALPDTEDVYIPKSLQTIDDGKTSVFTRYDERGSQVVVNGRLVQTKVHNYGFVPLVPVNNIFVPNDAIGHSEIERWQTVAQELNALLTMASEIARDLAYPPILEFNNALGGRKIPKWRGQKIPVRRSDKGEGVQFMTNPAQIIPLLKQAELMIELFHFISLMPKAAAGVFEASVTSGFQAKLAMQPATLTSENRKIDWAIAIKEMIKMGLKIIEKEDPDALQIKVSAKETVKLENLANHDLEVIWAENLPVDIAREIQNLVMGIQNNLTSVTQAVDKFNVMMGLGSPTDTLDYLEKEAEDPTINPQRVTLVANAKQAIQALGKTLGQANTKLGELRSELNGGQTGLPEGIPTTPNANNLVAGAASPFPEERRPSSQAENPESISLESTGGVLPNKGVV